MGSLRLKIQVGYYVIGALLVGLSAFALSELQAIEGQILAGSRVSEFFDMTMEVRRFEKNYFLYGQIQDHDEAVGYLRRARGLLDGNRSDFAAIIGDDHISVLDRELDDYRRLILALTENPPGSRLAREEAHIEIRRHGKAITTASEQLAQSERDTLKGALASHRTKLIGFIVALLILLAAVGRLMSRIVAKPLLEMEHAMEAVARGRLDKITLQSRDREIVSLTNAFNRMLHEIEFRQGHLHFNDKLSSLGTLVSGVAHELNNPLSNISTSCQILIEELGDEDGLPRELLGQIDQQTERARLIVRSLLEFARARQGNRNAVPLRPLIEETLVFIRGQLPTPLRIVVDIPADIVIFADKQRIQHVFLNLIKNAVEATTEGDVTILATRHTMETALGLGDTVARFRNAAQCAPAEYLVDLEVRDTGTGIADPDLSHVFDPFFTTKEGSRGTGLGLFVAYEIVKEHGGCITVDSQPGKGSSFFVMLPVPAQTGDECGDREGLATCQADC